MNREVHMEICSGKRSSLMIPYREVTNYDVYLCYNGIQGYSPDCTLIAGTGHSSSPHQSGPPFAPALPESSPRWATTRDPQREDHPRMDHRQPH